MDNAEPCYCAYGAIGGHQRTARCFQGPYPAFAVAVAKARGNPRPPDRPIQFDGYHDCQDGPYCTHGLGDSKSDRDMRGVVADPLCKTLGCKNFVESSEDYCTDCLDSQSDAAVKP